MNGSIERALGFFAGFVLIILAAAVIAFIVYKKQGDGPKFDERQKTARWKAYSAAFWTLVAYLVTAGLFTETTGIEWASPIIMSFIGICISITVFASICIRLDAYFALNESPRFYKTIFAVIALINGVTAAVNLFSGSPFVENGRLTFRCMNIVVLAMFLALFIVLAINSAIRKREDGE